MEWISTEDKMPEKETIFWAMVEGFNSPQIMGYFYADDSEYGGWDWMKVYDMPYYDLKSKEWESDDIQWDDQYKVTHWMPLPEPLH